MWIFGGHKAYIKQGNKIWIVSLFFTLFLPFSLFISSLFFLSLIPPSKFFPFLLLLKVFHPIQGGGSNGISIHQSKRMGLQLSIKGFKEKWRQPCIKGDKGVEAARPLHPDFKGRLKYLLHLCTETRG